MQPDLPDTTRASVPEPHGRDPRNRAPLRALLEVLICSGYPTQAAIMSALAAFAIGPVGADGRLAPRFVFLVSAIDTVVLLSLILLLLRLGGQHAREVFLKRGTACRESVVGLTTIPFVFSLVIALQLGIHTFVPVLRNVPVNPFESLLGSPGQLAAFILLVLVAGGIREELQRAFLLHRFEQHLGGARVGLLATSVAFGLGHLMQGWDAALVTALLGTCWGALYLWRRNAIAGIVSHSLFNVGEILMASFALRS